MHNPTYRTYSIMENPKDIEREIGREVAACCWQEGGTLEPIKWMRDKEFDSYEEAYEWLKKTDNGWYDNRAVVYTDLSDLSSKKLEDLIRRRSEWREKKSILMKKCHFAGVKSAKITCKHCDSSISSKYMEKRNTCPVCGADMRPATILNTLQNYQNRIVELDQSIHAEKKGLAQKAKTKKQKWLVYYDYHT